MSLECHACGTRFRSAIAEARHRHNWPAYCKRNKRFAAFIKEHYPEKESEGEAAPDASAVG